MGGMEPIGSDRAPWERQRGESAKAYTAFRRFRDLGPSRSLAGCRSIERRCSYRWRWAPRAAAWDDEAWRRLDALALAAVAEPEPAVAVVDDADVLDLDGALASIARGLRESA